MASKMMKANSLTSQMIQTSKEIEHDRTRPYLIFDLTTDEKQIIYAELRNEGLTSAKNVRVSISPELKSEQRSGKPCTFIANILSVLASGRHLKDFIGTGSHFFAINNESKFEYNIIYEDFSGNTYSEKAVIDVTYMRTLQKISPKIVGTELEKVHQEIKDLNRTLTKIWREYAQIKNNER